MFLFRATHGKVLAGSSSFASQTTTAAAGRHVVSNPIRPSERYESTAASAHQSQSGTSGAHYRCRLLCRGEMIATVDAGWEGFGFWCGPAVCRWSAAGVSLAHQEIDAEAGGQEFP
jgi:hypothetical protein